MNILSGLTAVFILLKVCHVIDWNWWVIIAPAIIEVLFFGAVFWMVKKIADKICED